MEMTVYTISDMKNACNQWSLLIRFSFSIRNPMLWYPATLMHLHLLKKVCNSKTIFNPLNFPWWKSSTVSQKINFYNFNENLAEKIKTKLKPDFQNVPNQHNIFIHTSQSSSLGIWEFVGCWGPGSKPQSQRKGIILMMKNERCKSMAINLNHAMKTELSFFKN